MTIPPSLAQPSVSQAPFEETDPNAINKTILDAKGDLVVASAADTPAKLAVGTDGQVLVADSAAPLGVKWTLDPTTTVVDAKGDLLVGTGPDTLTRLGVGTNGQVLVADSSATEGIKWSSETDPNSINKSIIDAKGDLVVGTADDTPSRLGVGTNGQYLVADSAATPGIKWATPNIALGTETSGDYVANITQGTGVTITGGTGEGSTPTVAIGQDVGTGSSPAFAGLNVDAGTLYVDAGNNRVGVNDSTPSYSLDVTGDGHFTTNLTVDGTIFAPHIHGDLAGSIYYHIKNNSGSTITAGTPVYISGTVGATQVAEVGPARADTSSTMPAVGITSATLNNGDTGHMVVLGALAGLDTSTYTLNQPLYVAATGGLTNTRPTGASDIIQVVAYAARINASTGELIVNCYDQIRTPNSISISGNIATSSGTFTGNGSGLTSLNASNLSSGTVPSAQIGNDSVALGTKTTGDYVQTVSAGTGVTVTGGTGEGSTPTIAIGQAVATTSSPQFTGLTTTGTANLDAASVTNGVSANTLSATTSITGGSLIVDGIEIDTTGATTNQVLAYNGTKFVPTTGGGGGGGIPETLIDAKGDLIAGSAADTAARLPAGTNEHRLVADSGETVGLKYVADTTNYAIAAKGDLLAGTAADTVTNVTVGANNTLLVADSAQSAGVKWSATLSDLTLTSPTISTISNTGTLTLPTSTDTLVGRATTDTLTNKTLTAPVISTISNTGTLTLPTSTDTLVGRATTDTLTNKTLTSPVVNTATVTGGVVDQLQENWNIVASAATGTINVDIKTASSWYYTTNATANWTFNLRGDSGTTLSSLLAVGDSITVTFAADIGTTGYYATTYQIDGTGVTPKWQGGTAPSSGSTSATDIYTFTVIKRSATPTWTVLAAKTKFN